MRQPAVVTVFCESTPSSWLGIWCERSLLSALCPTFLIWSLHIRSSESWACQASLETSWKITDLSLDGIVVFLWRAVGLEGAVSYSRT